MLATVVGNGQYKDHTKTLKSWYTFSEIQEETDEHI